MTAGRLRQLAHRAVWGLNLQDALFRLREMAMALDAPRPPPSPDGKPIRPAYLRVQVIGTGDAREFLDAGQRTIAEFGAALKNAGGGFAKADAVLDLGCGCGRLARWVPLASGAQLSGSDINRGLIGWCKRHLVGDWRVNPLHGPLPFDDDAFDLVYACSVVTHLREATTAAWFAEVARVLQKGGQALVTFHDPEHPGAAPVAEALAETGYAVRFDSLEGANHLAAYATLERLQALAGDAFKLKLSIPSPETVCGQAIAVFERV